MINRAKQAGVSLVAAIFVITVLAVAVVFIQRLLSVSVATNNLALQGARAWQAAQAGAEWGIYRAIVDGSCVSSSTLNLTEGALNGFAVTVGCSSQSYTEEGSTVTIYNLSVVSEFGTLGATPEYASMRMNLILEN